MRSLRKFISLRARRAEAHQTNSVGDLRFRLPQLITKYTDDIDAKQFGASCPQQAIQLPLPDGLLKDTIDAIVNTLYPAVFPDDEDCE